MAPGYRASGQSRRTHRGHADHDIFEGLPVRNWKRDYSTIAPPPPPEIASQKNKWDVELPWGMPKDSHLLPQHSQDLLRLARSGKLYQQKPSVDDEEVDPDALVGEKPEKKDDDTKDKGYVVKTWKIVPKNLEGPEIEYLAKRRKGLRGAVIKTDPPPAPIVTKATVRKTDAEGNSYVEEVLVADGQTVEGEVISSTVVADPTTVTDPLATPQRRRPPPPKRKAKTSSRSKKKKSHSAANTAPGVAPTLIPDGGPTADGSTEAAIGSDGVKLETHTVGQMSANSNSHEDTPMEDVDDDDEGEDGEDGDSADEGDEGEDVDDQDHDEDHDMDQEDDSSAPLAESNPAVSHGADTSQPAKLSEQAHSLLPPIPQPEIGSPLKNSTSASDLHPVHASPHDDEAEADGDDDDVEHEQPASTVPQPIPASSEIPQNYYTSHNNVSHEGIGDEHYTGDEDMLEEFHDDNHEDGNLIQDVNIHNSHPDYQEHHSQPGFGFSAEHLQNEHESSYGHHQEQFPGMSATAEFRQGAGLDHSAEHDFALADAKLDQASGNDMVAQIQGPTAAEDSFEDLLANEEVGGMEAEEDDGDLMAGLDKHLLESSAVPETEQSQSLPEPLRASPDHAAASVLQDERTESVSQETHITPVVDSERVPTPTLTTVPATAEVPMTEFAAEAEPEAKPEANPETRLESDLPPQQVTNEVEAEAEAEAVLPISESASELVVDKENDVAETKNATSDALIEEATKSEEMKTDEEQRAIAELGGLPLDDKGL